MRLVNKRTAVVMELKPTVSEHLGHLEKELAQLFLEVYYAQKEDTKCSYQYMLAVLSDRQTWHVFILNLRLPIEVPLDNVNEYTILNMCIKFLLTCSKQEVIKAVY